MNFLGNVVSVTLWVKWKWCWYHCCGKRVPRTNANSVTVHNSSYHFFYFIVNSFSYCFVLINKEGNCYSRNLCKQPTLPIFARQPVDIKLKKEALMFVDYSFLTREQKIQSKNILQLAMVSNIRYGVLGSAQILTSAYRSTRESNWFWGWFVVEFFL